MHVFRSLQIWKIAFVMNRDIYRITSKFPHEELYGLTSQLRRASVSVSSNIAEGAGRRTNNDFRGFLYNALGSLREIESQFLISKDLGYIADKDFEMIIKILDELGGKISKFIQKILN